MRRAGTEPRLERVKSTVVKVTAQELEERMAIEQKVLKELSQIQTQRYFLAEWELEVL